MKILFVRLSSLGDVILSTGVIKCFKEDFPDSVCDVFTTVPFAPVFEGLEFVNSVIVFDKADGWQGLGKTAQEELNDYDYVIDLHSNLRSFALRTMVDAKFLRYRKDSAARRRFVRSKKVTDRLRLHVAEKYAEPLIKLGMKPRTLEQLRPVLHAEADAQGRHIVLNPFASKATKQWDKFPELASELVKLGFKVTVIGIGEFSEIDGVKNLTGATSLKEMFEVIASAETLITTDSGPMHAGVALGVKTVAVFGSTTKEFGFAPVFEGCSVAEVHGLPCRPCHVHGLPACPQGHFKCMKDISVEDVLRVVSGGF